MTDWGKTDIEVVVVEINLGYDVDDVGEVMAYLRVRNSSSIVRRRGSLKVVEIERWIGLLAAFHALRGKIAVARPKRKRCRKNRHPCPPPRHDSEPAY